MRQTQTHRWAPMPPPNPRQRRSRRPCRGQGLVPVPFPHPTQPDNVIGIVEVMGISPTVT
jgi:hypothetical protein